MDRVPIELVEGDTWRWLVECRDANGDPYDFGPRSAHMQLRRDLQSPPFAELDDDGNGLQLNTPEAGDISVVVSSSHTRGLCRGGRALEILTEIELRSADDPPDITSVVALRLIVLPEGTRVD